MIGCDYRLYPHRTTVETLGSLAQGRGLLAL
jgi:hypothetical protein